MVLKGEALRKYRREWYQRKSAGLVTRIHPIFTNEERISATLKSRKNANERRRARIKNFLALIFGDKCFFCGFKHRQLIHKKDGTKHKDFRSMRNEELLEVKNKKNEYVRVCPKCHKSIHWCMKYLNLTWNEINGLVA